MNPKPNTEIDSKLRLEVIACTDSPQQLIWAAMRQDYSENFVFDTMGNWPNEARAGELIVKHLLKGGKGHYGPLEHPSISFNVGWFPHSTMQQLRTHRVGVSFDVQSGRYTSERILDVLTGDRTIDDVFYLRPVGFYTDRKGKKYQYTEAQRENDRELIYACCEAYSARIHQGFSEEHARDLINFGIRQNWVMTLNVRSMLHMLDMRYPKDAQLECQILCWMMLEHAKKWVPDVIEWYIENRLGKKGLAP